MPPSVVVVGGGIIGCATAYELAKAGCRVTLFERALLSQAILGGSISDLIKPFLPDRLLDRSPHAHTR